MKFEVGKKYHNTCQGTVNGKIVYYVCQWVNHEKAVLALEHMAYDDVREPYKLLPVAMRDDGPWVEYKKPVVHTKKVIWVKYPGTDACFAHAVDLGIYTDVVVGRKWGRATVVCIQEVTYTENK